MRAIYLISLFFLTSVYAQETAFTKLHSSYLANPAEFAKKNFGKQYLLKAKITGISRNFDSSMYIISLHDSKGKVYIQPTEISANIKDKLYDLRNQDIKETNAEIKLTLVKGEGQSLLFAKIISIKLIPIKKKPEKKKEPEKKKKQLEKKKKKN
ncbi:MAG: hypothetical protein NE328_06140 [Lentisphaeraceae bacterium]|nr:hypothetical protein [Lentisphaeraceae bacterium]